MNDALLPLLGIGERLHPEFDGMFISKPDQSVQVTVSVQSLKTAWQEINQKLWDELLTVLGIGLGTAAHRGVGRGFRAGTASESIHGTAGRTVHLAYHVGQATLARPKA